MKRQHERTAERARRPKVSAALALGALLVASADSEQLELRTVEAAVAALVVAAARALGARVALADACRFGLRALRVVFSHTLLC